MEIREEIIFLYSCQVGTFVKGLRSWHGKFHRNNLFKSITQLGPATESSAHTPHPPQAEISIPQNKPHPHRALGRKAYVTETFSQVSWRDRRKNHSPYLRVNETPHQTFLLFSPRFLPLGGPFLLLLIPPLASQIPSTLWTTSFLP